MILHNVNSNKIFIGKGKDQNIVVFDKLIDLLLHSALL